ncbi:MaoC family dehydratase [Amycolatopsis acidicola]|uniref:MaoC family dehydratase n=2 Tax=Amycolatopsis acidicola TaxID=2596893 RepID=A0A5N0UV37_9PSEU|nr:MaoC family dehydratase [Amycolatopsis acidicola]
MAAAVGTTLSRQVSYPVSESDIRRWAIAVYWPEPPPARFLQNSAAPAEFNPFAWAVAERVTATEAPDPNDPDSTEKLAGIPGPGLRFLLNGGLSAEYGAPIRPGDVITSVRRLGPYSEREGRLGRMLFTRTEDTWTNQDGAFVRRAVATIIRY